MLLRHRPPKLDMKSIKARKGFEHLDEKWIAVLRWLNANRVDYVVVGAVAEAARGSKEAGGPVAIVPAPYGRNFERLARALSSEHARLRLDGDEQSEGEGVPVKITGEKLARGRQWALRFGVHELDLEGVSPGGRQDGREKEKPLPGYQELLYEANRFELAAGVSVEVASPEDIEHFAQLRRTGSAPEIRIRRAAPVEQG
jgi:hypothetical protein